LISKLLEKVKVAQNWLSLGQFLQEQAKSNQNVSQA